ncbi:protein translocase subunit SecF [Alginatibacterium sediminis]|uniref:Protein-export membrane protein SecF n=1 Tax=Alginatibacterium sediminis TaxID=2164068 RepID=A0A420E8W9_9ALTE|nr:protein translocase subunit SecF [Alginatibacterium sediminis]RKF15542.1 protein translocase subunit SecF [Alginatibacterium sediminis]
MYFSLFNPKGVVPFMSHRKPFVILSILIVLASFASLAINKINWGLDFTGGTLIEAEFSKPADLTQVREILTDKGFDDVVVQFFGSSTQVMLRMMPREGENSELLGDQIMQVLRDGTGDDVTMRRIEFVGPTVGKELAEQGGLAIIAALGCIMLYVALRFEWRMALGAVLALAHDVIATLGLFSLLGIEFDLTVVAALLTVVGYSLNDTIVVSDRIRENFRKLRKGSPEEIIDTSLTQTFNRTIVTSLTTIMVLISLFFLGGEMIHSFATALLFGVIIGTHSSIYVSSTLALALGVKKEDFMPKEIEEKEGADQEPLV